MDKSTDAQSPHDNVVWKFGVQDLSSSRNLIVVQKYEVHQQHTRVASNRRVMSSSPATTEDQPGRGADVSKICRSSKSSRWCDGEVKRGGASSGSSSSTDHDAEI
ncbi:hypothetical protein TNCV_4922141 [Trichonephila clavipes]|nr:hypothetical protein TNCV_4922141 [Trichonephila clavipes]